MSIEQKLYWSRGYKAGVKCERERVLDVLRQKSSELWVDGHRDSQSRYVLKKLIDELEKANTNA